MHSLKVFLKRFLCIHFWSRSGEFRQCVKCGKITH